MSSVGESLEIRRVAAVARDWPRGWLIGRALVAADIVGLVLAFSVTQIIFGGVTKGQTFSTRAELGVFVLTLPVWILLAKLYGLYDRDESRTEHHTVDDLGGVFHLATVGTWLVVAGARLSGLAHPQLNRVTVFWALAITGIVMGRSVARAVCRRHASYVQNTLVVGTGEEGRLIARKLVQNPQYGLRVVGFVDCEPGVAVDGFPDLGVVGTLDDLPRLVWERSVRRVVMGFTDDGHDETLRHVRELNARGVQVDVIPRFPELVGPAMDMSMAGGIALWSLRPFRLSGHARAVKRCVDVALSAIGLLVLAPVFAVAAVAIKLDSPGAVFFRQERVKDARHTFRMWKLRTMVADAEERKREIEHLNIHVREGGDGQMFKVENDPRVTRVGRVLRRYSLDELPQLLNVLRGEMSLVGPRPLIPEEHMHVTEWRRRRLEVKPGLTGLWQVNGRSTVPFEEMVGLDYRYVTHWSLLADVRLLLQTLPQLLKGSAATH